MIGKVDQHKVKKHTTFLINNNQYSSDTKIIANQFNEYFTNVGYSLSKKTLKQILTLCCMSTIIKIPGIFQE